MSRFLTVCAALALMMTMALPASAVAGGGSLTMAMALDEGGIIAVAPAVIVNDKGICTVITDADVHADVANAYGVNLDDGVAQMVFQNEMSELALFTLDASYLSQPKVLDIAQSIQVGEELAYFFIYVDEEDTMVVLEGSARIIEQDGDHKLDVTLPNDVNQARITYPAVAVTRAGELAIIDGRQKVVPFCTIEGNGAAPASKADNPGLSIETVVGIVVVAAAAVAGLVFSRKKSGSSNSGTTPAQPITSTQPMEPVQLAPLVPDIPERIEPVKIKSQPRPKTSVLYLCCEGGALDGQRYPVGTTTLLIGRDPSCNIRYPADTKGVSRRHCEIFWKNGVLLIMDLGSTSGTFIREKGQIMANVPVAVNAGDTFYLGEKRNGFVIRMGDAG